MVAPHDNGVPEDDDDSARYESALEDSDEDDSKKGSPLPADDLDGWNGDDDASPLVHANPYIKP
jgi:hypothetical protein